LAMENSIPSTAPMWTTRNFIASTPNKERQL
jgi:hypothetical protein